MRNNNAKQTEKKVKITKVEITDEKLSGRGGLSLFANYYNQTGIGKELEKIFSNKKGSSKGQSLEEIFKQITMFLVDGTSRHISRFDDLKRDEGYAHIIGSAPESLLSSHAVKRFFAKFGRKDCEKYRQILKELFILILKSERPGVIELDLDSMVLDNDEARVREGVEPTYKKKKGFHPLQLVFGGYILDAIFRSGSKHSNHGDDAVGMIKEVVRLIRREYSKDALILIRMDSGFFDQDLFKLMDVLGVGFICGGKMYNDISEYISEVSPMQFSSFRKTEDHEIEYVDFGDCRGSWDKWYRVIYYRHIKDERGQKLLEFAREESIVYTNIGMGGKIDKKLKASNREALFESEELIRNYHMRGKGELVHRALKDFRSEQLPFKRFNSNAAFYYLVLVAFFLFESFKRDVLRGAVVLSAYATTVRRQVFDIAGKIIGKSRAQVLKIPRSDWVRLKFDTLWERSLSPPLKVFA